MDIGKFPFASAMPRSMLGIKSGLTVPLFSKCSLAIWGDVNCFNRPSWRGFNYSGESLIISSAQTCTFQGGGQALRSSLILDILPCSFWVSIPDRAREGTISPESVFFPEASLTVSTYVIDSPHAVSGDSV
jgi:hypothetical protein